MKSKIAIFAAFIILAGVAVWAGLPTTINDFFFPGSQPNQSGNLETPDKCDNCHGGYDQAVEPAFNWRGSMMSQAARDPLFYACLAISNQDAPESGDLCIRCHSPAGWLEGRSTPTDGSALNNNDREGVQCDFCHKLVKPTPLGVNPYPDDSIYTADTYPEDQTYLSTITDIPPMSGNGAYVADGNNAKRGPFFDAAAKHQKFYSPFHSDIDICGSCHDVSNPAYYRDSLGDYVPTDFDQPAPDFNTYAMFPIERTYSEWKYSAYNTPGGIYAPQFGGNKQYVSTCQDCHMKDVTGVGCNKAGVPTRDNLPLHDLTGGNTFIPLLIDSVFPGESDSAALGAGTQRATGMLQKAATLEVSTSEQGNSYLASVRVTNETGHKLPSGYPEGRRIWLNLKAYNASDNLIYESGAYDPVTGVLTHDADAKIYEIKPGLSETVANILGYSPGPSFHFAVNDTIFSDNRIPPRGFTNAEYEMIQSPPINYTYADSQYWDDTQYLIPGATAQLDVTLYYQTTSKDYVEFLRDENTTNDWGDVFYSLWNNNGKSAPVVMNSQTINLTPMGGNQPPVLDSIGDKSVDEGVNLDFTVTGSDPDGTPPALTAEPLPDGANYTDHNDGTATFDWTPTFDQADVYDITFYATDDSGAVDSEAITITVNNVNRPPVLDSIGNKSVDEGVNLNFTVTGSDPDGTPPDPTAEPLPDGANFTDHGDGTATFDWTPTFDQADVYDIVFYATDDSGAVDSEAITITVNNVNRPPVLDSIGDYSTEIGDTILIIITAVDPDGDSVTITAENLPPDASFSYEGWDEILEKYYGEFFWVPNESQIGTYGNIRFIASDGTLTDDETITITVTGTTFLCGDANSDGTVSIFDITYIISYLYLGGPAPAVPVSADVNNDATINVFDITYLVAYLYLEGPEPNCPTQ